MIAAADCIGGTLLPERYVAGPMLSDARDIGLMTASSRTASRLAAWWTGAEASCGPATHVRTLFDLVAMPLFGILGFSAHDAEFAPRLCRARLMTRAGTRVALLLTPWASRAPTRWVDVARHARTIGAAWGFVLAPPFLSIVPTRGFASRRSLDLALGAMPERNGFGALALAACADAFDPADRTRPGHARLDELMQRAATFQDAVRRDLQQGVVASLGVLRPVVRTGRAEPVVDEALTLVFRILFLLFVESRNLVPHHDPIYRQAYAAGTFWREAADGRSEGLWDGLAASTRLLRLGCRSATMRVSPFNGPLFARASAPTLERRPTRRRRAQDAMRDEALREAFVALASRQGRAGLEAINYRDLGVEQLGAVYERVLDLPATPDSGNHLATPHTGNRPAPPGSGHAGRGTQQRGRHSSVRKRTGTFYTPQPLADFVVRRTLAPLVDNIPSDAILALRVVDPAMGSGAFLVAACRFLAGAYEEALIAEGRLSPADVGAAERAEFRRLIAERCLAGVDRNPAAVHLARLSLWLTALARDKPLTFLDHRLRVGDSLVGAWPGDLSRLSSGARSRSSLPLFDTAAFGDVVRSSTRRLFTVLARRDDTVADVRAKEQHWQQFVSAGSSLGPWRLALDLWCARWFQGTLPPPDPPEVRAMIDVLLRGDRTLPARQVDRRLDDTRAVAASRRFFHWPLEFPDIFQDADDDAPGAAGFDAVIGNPPWEMVRRDDGTNDTDHDGVLPYVRQSGQFPSCGRGHLNLYQAFVDRALALARPGARLGLVLPWSLASDDGASALRKRLLRETSLDVVVGIDNTDALFPIHRGLRFLTVVTTTGGSSTEFQGRCGLSTRDDLDAFPARGEGPSSSVRLTPHVIELVSGPACRFPDVRRTGDLDLLTGLASRFPKLGAPDGWHVSFGRELNATESRPIFTSTGVPVVEGKHITPFQVDSSAAVRRHVDRRRLASAIDPARIDVPRLGYRDVSGVGNRLTLIAAVIPAGVVTTHTVFCLREKLDATRHQFLCALFNSYVLNAIVRCLMGGHVTTTLAESLPVPAWRGDVADLEIARLARELASGDPGRAARVVAERTAAPTRSARAAAGRVAAEHTTAERPTARVATAARLQGLVAARYELDAGSFRHVLAGFPLVPADEREMALRYFLHERDRDAR